MSVKPVKKILYIGDSSFLFLLSNEAKTEEIYAWVDHLTREGAIDIYSQMVFAEGWVQLHNSKFAERDSREKYKRLDSLFSSGIEPLNLLIERSHANGMEFLANFRMNDRQGENKKFLEEHKE